MIIHFSLNIFVFLFATCLIQTSFCYIMPVCSDSGGVCNEFGENCQKYIEQHNGPPPTSHFAFVTPIMDVSRKWLYEWVFGVEVPKPVEIKKPSYMESMWTFFGFALNTDDITPAEEEPSSTSSKYNLSFIGLVGASYFGYIFLATHYMNRKNEAEKRYFASKFNNYLGPDSGNIFDGNMLLGRDSNDTISTRGSRCKVCERHKLAMESPPENTKEIKAKQISSLPNFGVSTLSAM